MKKLGKFLMVGAVATTVALGAIGFAACGNGGSSYTGEYHYTNHGHEYGVKVKVEIEKASNILESKIKSVTIVDSDYVQLSDVNEDYGWTEEKRQVYLNGEAALLEAYKGQPVLGVASAIRVVTAESGDPESVEFMSGITGDGLVITGATQSSGRIILAVQDAIEEWAEANKDAIQKALQDAMGDLS